MLPGFFVLKVWITTVFLPSFSTWQFLNFDFFPLTVNVRTKNISVLARRIYTLTLMCLLEEINGLYSTLNGKGMCKELEKRGSLQYNKIYSISHHLFLFTVLLHCPSLVQKHCPKSLLKHQIVLECWETNHIEHKGAKVKNGLDLDTLLCSWSAVLLSASLKVLVCKLSKSLLLPKENENLESTERSLCKRCRLKIKEVGVFGQHTLSR